MLTSEDKKLGEIIFRLLKNATSQSVVKEFLKTKRVPISAANWDELFTKRIEPALTQKKFTIDEFRSLLQSVEEYGRQHCFLFTCTPLRAQALLKTTRIESLAKELGIDGLLKKPLDLELPDEPTIVDLRIINPDPTKEPAGLVIKIVETRRIRKFSSEDVDQLTGDLIKRYTFTEKRSVSIAHLRSDGFLELRIASQDNQTRYHDLVRAMLGQISTLIPHDGFSIYSLSAAKAKIYKDRVGLAQDLRYSTSTARNDLGAVMQLSSSAQEDNLSDDDGSMGALDTFLGLDGHVTGTNVFVRIPNMTPEREVHLLISGDLNEFAVPAACSEGEYAYVRGKVVSLNS